MQILEVYTAMCVLSLTFWRAPEKLTTQKYLCITDLLICLENLLCVRNQLLFSVIHIVHVYPSDQSYKGRVCIEVTISTILS